VKGRATVDVTFEVLPLRGYFGTVVTADDTERHKPDPEPLLLVLERLGADVADAAYVGDSPFDIRAAKAAGMIAVAVAWGGIHPLSRLEAERPDHVVHAPQELLDVL
jgi:pyrophosphatase PpaX